MKIIEVRDGIIKFETDGSLTLSSFIKVKSSEKNYIAQVLQLKPDEHVGFAKILFLYDGFLLDYDKTTPNEDSELEEFTSDILKNAFDVKSPVIAGKINGENIVVDSSIFDKKMLVCADDKDAKNIIIKNLSKQFNNIGSNVIIIDTLGTINAQKYVAGKDFKLPLDKSSLKFMYEDCLNDATMESKSMIVDIFKDLAEYSETVKFLPFNALKTIVDDMVDKSHVFKLLVLKNKLSKFDKLGYFAKNSSEVEKIEKILNSKCVIIDVSKLDSVFQNKYISYIYENIKNKNTRFILELSNNISKKTLKEVFDNNSETTFVSHTMFKYIADIKSMFDNFIIYPTEGAKRLFNIYSAFLRSMDNKSYLIVGEGTNYIPFVSSLESIEEISSFANKQDATTIEENEEDDDSRVLENYVEEVSASSPSSEIIATINEKSSNTISDIAQNLEVPQNMEMFSDEEEEETNEEQEEIVEQDESEIDVEELVLEPEIQQEISAEEEFVQEEILEENEEIPYQSELTGEQQEEHAETENQDVSAPEDFSEEESEIVEPKTMLDESENLEEETLIDIGDMDLDLEPEEEILDAPAEGIRETEEQEIIEPEFIEESENAEPIQPEVIPLEEEFSDDEIVELDPSEAGEGDILIDMGNDDIPEEEIEDKIKKEADKVYTTRKEDDFSENDLDFIDELNSEEEVVLEIPAEDDSILEELTEENNGIIEDYQPEPKKEQKDSEILETKNSTTPIVPVYDADIPQEDMVESDPIQQGDNVTHVKYGSGVVEKLVKYGSKTLFMINFDMGGRKLLDPLLTEIKKA